jgi:rhamnogalacturonyl hydrolase YesR
MKHETLTFRFLDMSRGSFARLFLLLLLPCLSVIGVKAADSNGGVKFNSGVRYSQWAINSRLHDFYGNQKKFGFDYYDNNGTPTKGVTWYKLDGKTEVTRTFDYVAGLVGKASLEAADFYENFDWSKPWFYAAQGYATGTPYANKDMTLDNMNAAKMYFPILAGKLMSPDAETIATKAISEVIAHMKTYNSTYVIGRGKSALANTNANNVQKTMIGGWFHKSSDYTDQMWCDGQYMGPALLAQIIKHTGKTNNISDNDWTIIEKQFSITWAQLYDKTTGLLYHGFTANPGDNASTSWAGISKEKGIYHSASFWGRANAWYFLALVDILEVMPTDNAYYNTFKGYLTDLAAGIAKYQDKDTGCWYQVMDKVPASLTGNYLEASCSSIFTAGYLKAIRLGLLDKATYEPIAKKAYEGLVNQFMVYDNKDNSTIQLVHSCTSAGLGGGDKRAGDDNYYLTGKDASVVTSSDPTSKYYYTEGKVLGGFIMAATEYERAYQNQNQDNKQILFAKDLAPSYDFTTTEGKLDATAYGNGIVSYLWYKDGKAIANATSAIYTPKESGSYYCEATANDKTITTSTTTVKAKNNSNTDNGSTDNNGGSDNGTTTGNIFSYTIKTSEATANTPHTATGGTVTLGAANNVYAENGYKLGSDFNKSGYIKITLSGTKLQEGDIIKISANSASTGKGGLVAYTGTTAGSSSVSLGNMTQKSEDISYTVTASDILNGLSTFYIYRKTNESTYVKSISITRSVKKYKVSATAGTGGSVSIANASGTTVNSGSEVEENTSLTFTATPNEGYEFVNWTDASNNSVSIDATYTTTVTAAISLTANFKAKTTVTPTESGVIYDFPNSVGTTIDGTNCTTTNNVITFSSNFSAKEGKYITIKPKTGGFKAGDVITLKGYCNSKNLSGVIIYSDVNGSSIFKSNILATSAAGGSEFTYTIEKDCDALYLGRYGGGTTCLTSLQVERPAPSSNKTRLTASFARNADVVVNTTTTVTLPTLTVNAGENILAANQYDVVYKSNAENVATLSDNTITIKSLGIATITATVTPKNTDTYEGTTATYQLSVKAPSPLNVSVMDVTINTTDAEEEQPVIKVYGDNDKLLKLGQDYTLSFAVSGDNVTVDKTTGKFSVKKNAEKTAFIKGTSLITVTATPTTSLGSNYIAGTLQFSYSVSEGKIKPVFLDSFKDITINLHQDNKNRTITVPLIYNGEDVSSYFKYTYTITPTGNTSSVTGSELNYTPSTAGKYTVTVSATPGQNGEDNYGDVYDSPDPISFDLDVKNTYQVITVTPDPTSIKMYAGTTKVAPDLTVTDGNTTLADTEYKTLWFSTSPGVVKVDATTGKLEAVSEGNANIRVVVTGKTLESTTALITVDVDDPAVYRVHANEEYKSQKTMWNQDENLSVTLGGWLFPNDVKGLWTTTESLSKTVEWNKDDSQKNYNSRKAPWKITGFDYMVKAGDKQKNARQENGSNSMPETTLISNVDYSKRDNIVDPMFNVPCSGSFLTFQPKTNGTVVAHIYQNGVFDSKKNNNTIDYQYRPQRRVFIMDEAGNFVSSDAHIESTTGKPNGKNYDLTQYKWDMGDKQSPTVETVKKHFGLESFEMSETGFKNNVYENQLDQTIAPNEAAIKYPNLKGSRGWSVLADAPVTYTFKVKAGKTYYLYNFGSKIGFYGFSFDEDEAKIVDPVEYDADNVNTNNKVEKTAEGHVAQVKIARKMVANRWTTCVLPFSLNRDQVDAIFGPAYCAEHPQGTQILYFDRIEGNKAYFVRHAYNTIVAGKPFLIKPTKEVTSINTADVTNYPYVTIENTKPADWCESKGYVWTSSYNTMNIVKNDYFIGASDGNFKAYSAASGTVKGFRGFLKANLSPGAKPVMLSISTSSVTDGNDGETTGIEDLIITTDGELMPANSRVYNINGQLVSEDASSFQSLPSGIYIINGKKYIK